MGTSFCVVFESDVPSHGTLGGDHPTILRRQRALDRLARANGLTPLADFESYDPADAAELLDEDEVAELPAARWFDPVAGRAAVQALAGYLEAHANAVPGQINVLAELEEIASELADAARAGTRFRFAVVP